MQTRLTLFLAGTLFCTATLSAQTITSTTLSHEGAVAALAAAQTFATSKGWRVSIAIVDPAGDLLAFTRLDGASPATVETAIGKARTAARYRGTTARFDSLLTGGRIGVLTLRELTALEGGIPIRSGEVVIGGIGVSGAASTQDAEVARAGIAVVRP